MKKFIILYASVYTKIPTLLYTFSFIFLLIFIVQKIKIIVARVIVNVTLKTESSRCSIWFQFKG